MKTLYLDIFSGVSGDMFIGAMIDLGLEPKGLEAELQKLRLDGYHIHVRRGQKQSIEGVKFDVHLAHSHDEGSTGRVATGGPSQREGHHLSEDEHRHEHEHEHVHHDAEGREYKHTHPHSHDEGSTGRAATGGPSQREGRHLSEDGHHHHEHGHHHHQEDEHEHAHEHEHEHAHEHGRNYAQIKELIGKSALSAWVKDKAVAVFHRIAVAEGAIHGLPPEKVHFHEVGAVDSIVDIVGACICLEMLGKPRVLAGQVVEGTGFINCAHGRFPIPAPATLAILGQRRIPVSQTDEPHELITPTGAALLVEFAESFGPMHGIVAEKIGFGLGTRENHTRPNVLRAVLGESDVSGQTHDWETDTIAVLEANVDDLNPEVLGHFVGQALDEGALDVFHTAIQMKKNRPGILLTVLCAEADADKFSEMMLRQTSSFGVRRSISERRKLRREFVSIKTPHGSATIKLGRLDGKVVQIAPEFESCRKLAEQGGITLKEAYAAALQAYNK